MHQTIEPMVFLIPGSSYGGNTGYTISVKLTGSDIPGSIDYIEKTWKQYLPEVPFEYTFLDERFDKLYKTEQQQGSLFTTFSGIAIFIACLGLFGLSAFTITQRIKEIGVRRVLGASTGSIVTLISKDFLKLVTIAALIAFPVAWYAMYKWLGDFAYRISIQWWVFLAAGTMAALIALLTVSFQAVRAALSNPVKSLRSE
jgi:putative ABC transport system permease protein